MNPSFRVHLARSHHLRQAWCTLLMLLPACGGQESRDATAVARERAAHASATTLAGDTTRATLGTSLDAESARAATSASVDSALSGARLGETPCVQHLRIACAVHVVASFNLDSVRVQGDTARVGVRYVVIGSLVQGDSVIRYLPRDTTKATPADTVVLARTASGWRVLHHDTEPRVSARLALAYFYLDDQTREQIAVDAQTDWGTSSLPVFTSPAALTQLPASVRDSLGARGCTVLQTRGNTTKNVVRGAFFGRAEDDWAVLCTIGLSATILVFPGDGGAPASLETVGGEVPDLTRPPNLSSSFEPYGCATSIFGVPASAMQPDVRAGELTGQLEGGLLTASERAFPVHDGLGSGDCEGLSNIYYWTGERWVRFAGGD